MGTIWQRPWIRIVSTLLTVALMTGIFLFSHQGKSSETTSESFAFVIIDTVHPEYEEASAEEQIDIWNTAQHIARKAAHVIEYMALGFLLRICLESWFGGTGKTDKKKKLRWIAFAIGALYAVSDEIHQYFVPGRSSEILDMLVDSLGVFPGVLLAERLIVVVNRSNKGEFIMEPWTKKKLVHSMLLAPVFGALLTMCLELGLNFLRPDSVGSILRHLAIFAVFTVLMAGAILLCAYTKPIRRFWDWLDTSLLSPETRKPFWDIIYAVLAALMLVHHFYVMLYYPRIPAGASKLAPAWIVLAVVTVLMGKTWKHKGFLFSSFFLIYTFENLYLRKLTVSGEAPVYFSSALYALFLAYGVFFVLRPKYRRGFLKILCAAWSLGTMAYCGVGLYTAWTGESIKNLVDAGTRIFSWEGRLHIFAEPTITAANASSGAVMALIGLVASKHWPMKIAYLVSLLVAVMTTTLTDSRSSILMISFILAGMVALGVWGILGKYIEKVATKKHMPMIAILTIASFASCFILAWNGQRMLPRQFVEIRNRGGILISVANADEEHSPTSSMPAFVQRDVEVSSDENQLNQILNGRWDIWKNAQQYIEKNPDILILGLTVNGSAAEAVYRNDHVHNIFIQTLLEGGIPGLIIFLVLLGYFVCHAIRLWIQWELPLWQRVLPMPVLALLLMEMAECLTHFAFGHPPMTIMYFFMGCTVAVSLSLKEKSDAETREG